MRSPTGAEPRAVRCVRRGVPTAAGCSPATTSWRCRSTRRTRAASASRCTPASCAPPTSPSADQPYLLFLQGGPGGRSPRPGATRPAGWSWALRRYRVLLLDQRGTGRSTPAGPAHARRPHARRSRPTGSRSSGPTRSSPTPRCCAAHLLGDAPWTTLGQSFGGFCTWTYLSFAPEGLPACFVTGGVPPMGVHSRRRLPGHPPACERRIAELDARAPRGPGRAGATWRGTSWTAPTSTCPPGSGSRCTRLQEVGHVLRRRPRARDRSRSSPRTPGRGHRAACPTPSCAGVARPSCSYATGPLYALVHEACCGEPGVVTGWSSQRVRAELGVRAEPVREPDGAVRLPLTGENVHPSSVAADPALAPLREAADLLAERRWDRPLYDPPRLAAQHGSGRRVRVRPRHVRGPRALAGHGLRHGRGHRRRGRGPPPRRPAPQRPRGPGQARGGPAAEAPGAVAPAAPGPRPQGPTA